MGSVTAWILLGRSNFISVKMPLSRASERLSSSKDLADEYGVSPATTCGEPQHKRWRPGARVQNSSRPTPSDRVRNQLIPGWMSLGHIIIGPH